jgi:deoxyribodipyrimidine photolyase-related protein
MEATVSSAFLDALGREDPDVTSRTWVYVAYDQLTDAAGPLAEIPPEELGILLVENPTKGARRPYHPMKLVLVLSNMRHFALEQRARGVAVRWRVASSYAEPIRELAEALGAPVRMMEAAERELRHELQPVVDDGLLTIVPHAGWLTTPDDFEQLGEKPWRMDAFYRHVRQRTGILMEDGKPAGGRYSHDGDNRERWDGPPAPPDLPRFAPDAITEEVVALVESQFADHHGAIDVEAIPCTKEDAERLWQWALDACMEHFGPYEDAMTTRHSNLFHTRISSLLNLHRLLPARVVRDVEALDIPINSKEGFIRQVLGWLEFVRHVHRATDGFRHTVPRNVLGQQTPLPAAFWGTPSGLACLDGVVSDVWREAYSHHIPRLMVLANIAQLIDANPRELTDWFWVAYIDAYDWVVEPNVLGMGTFSIGDAMTTKPYVSGSGYVKRMSDYCDSCAFHHKKTCPLTPMYWAYLDRHRDVLEQVDRARRQVWGLNRRSDDKKKRDRAVYERVLERWGAGEPVTPSDFDF